MKKLILLFVLLFCSTSVAFTGGVDVSEVIRRGDMVEHVTGYGQPSPESLMSEAMKLPANDAGKWFISVITTDNCSYCDKLKKDWKSSKYLRSLAVVGNQKQSWAHLNFYDVRDESQKYRWRNLKFRGFPSILVQAPRDGSFGNPSDIVFFKAGYKDDETLTRSIIDAIKLRISKQAIQALDVAPEGIGVDPPWDVEPEGSDTRPNRLRPFLVPDVPPKEAPGPFPAWTLPGILAGGQVMWVAIGGLLWWGFEKWREYRKTQGKKELIQYKYFKMMDELAQKAGIERDNLDNKEPKE